MFSKRTRLFIHFNLINFFQILKSLIFKKKNFLENLKLYLQKDNLSLTSLGRTALYDIIRIIIKKSGRNTFIIAPYTIPAVIHAIKYAGGVVDFVDMNEHTGLIDEKKLEVKINNQTAGVLITHLYSDKKSIKNFIQKFENKVTIIEDAAINFGAKLDDKFLGTLGHYGFYSFALVKNLNTFTGGALYIKDKQIYDDYISRKNYNKFPLSKTFSLMFTAFIIKFFFNNIFYQISHYFLKIIYKKKIKFFMKKIYPVLFHKFEKEIPNYYFQDFNWLMNDVGNYNLKKINSDLMDRLDKAKSYSNLISDEVAIKTKCLNGENALLEYPIILKKINNVKAQQILFDQGYDIRLTWYINNINQDLNLTKNNFKDTYAVEKKILCLPLHKNISTDDINKISSIVNTFR